MTAAVTERVRRSLLSGRRLGWLAVALVPLAIAGLALASIGGADEGITRVPVALVNNDEMITQVDEETGEETIVLAGRLLVTELTGPDSAAALDWRLTNSDDAAKKLAAGEVYAILTIPEDFSDAVLSIQSDEPRQANIDIRTDDAHSYVAGPVAEALGSGMVRAFGTAITENVVTTLLDQVGNAFTTAADGAAQLADGAGQLSDGTSQFVDGVGQYTSGVSQLAAGTGQLSSGASGLANGANDLAKGIASYAKGANQLSASLSNPEEGLPALVDGIGGFTGQVQGLSGGLTELSAALSDAVAALQEDPTDPVALGTVAAIAAQLDETAQGSQLLAAGGAELSQKVAAAVHGVHTPTMEVPGLLDGIDQLADGADQLAGGANQLASGAQQLAGGVGELSNGAGLLAANGGTLAGGASDLSEGVTRLADGTQEFANGMAEGSEAFADTGKNERMAKIISDPVGYAVETDHSTASTGPAIANALVPYAAWIGGLLIFLVVPPFRARTLATSTGSVRLLLSALVRAGALAVVQAVLLAIVIHTAGGVSWELLPKTLGFLLLLAVVFAAFHGALVAAFGQAGLVGSFFVLALQFASSGILLPVEILAPVFASLSPYLPLTWASSGFQQILTGGSSAIATGSVIALILFGVGSLVVALVALRRSRRTAVIGLLAPAA